MIRWRYQTRLELAVTMCMLLSLGALIEALAPGRPPDDGLKVETGLPQSAVGYGALAALLRAQGVPVTYAPIDGQSLLSNNGLVIVAPISPRIFFPKPDHHALGRVLYLPPKWKLRRDPRNADWVRSPGLLTDEAALRSLQIAVPPSAFRHTAKVDAIHWWSEAGTRQLDLSQPGPVVRLRSVARSRLGGVLGVNERQMILLQNDPFLFLSDPDFLNNVGMADRRTASMAVRLIDQLRANGPVRIAPSYILTLPPPGKLRPSRAHPLSLAFLRPSSRQPFA